MSENPFKSQLINQNAPALGDPVAIAAEAVLRDRRTIRRLAGLTIGLWLLDILFVPSFLLPLAAKLVEQRDSIAAAQANKTLNIDLVANSVHEVLSASAIASSWIVGTMTL